MDKLINNLKYIFKEDEKLSNVKNYIKLFDLANQFTKKKEYILASECYNKIFSSVDSTEYLLLNCKPRIPRNVYIESLMNCGNLLKFTVEGLINLKLSELNKNNSTRTAQITLELSSLESFIFNKSLNCFISILQIDFEHTDAIKQIISIYTHLTYFSQTNFELCLRYLSEALIFAPENSTIHYNLGHIYQKLNKLELSIVHYKISIQLNKILFESLDIQKKLFINNYNGIASIYRGIKKWPESLYFLLKAHKIENKDPDINNQLGVVYTEMRESEIAEKHYKLAITNYLTTFISTDPKFLLSEIYLNFGHMYSYNGDNNSSIECYNKSLINVPKFSLPFQNKLMNLNYIFDQLDDKMYITQQHKLINKLYSKANRPYLFNKDYFTEKINIGIISADFIDHPVSYFITTYLKKFDSSKFSVTCYSESIIDTSLFNKNLQFKIIKNMSQQNASDLIYKDKIHILLDLAGHTSGNRMDIFSFKPAPIQITYLGYPFTTGLNEMQYRITDKICDGDFSVSQQFYSEELIELKNCFLCYDPYVISRNDINQQSTFVMPKILDTPKILQTNKLVIACFNRINKITDSVIVEFNKILLSDPNIIFLFKTKALINTRIKNDFVKKFHISVQNQIEIIDCTLSHLEHLKTYNQADISIDTFPYSGTTTSCESLMMGLPVFSIRDTEHFFHATNVSCSILTNSGLDFYICQNTEEIIKKIKILQDKPVEFWKTNKQNTRDAFLSGKVCNQIEYMHNIQELFTTLYNKHKS